MSLLIDIGQTTDETDCAMIEVRICGRVMPILLLDSIKPDEYETLQNLRKGLCKVVPVRHVSSVDLKPYLDGQWNRPVDQAKIDAFMKQEQSKPRAENK